MEDPSFIASTPAGTEKKDKIGDLGEISVIHVQDDGAVKKSKSSKELKFGEMVALPSQQDLRSAKAICARGAKTVFFLTF